MKRKDSPFGWMDDHKIDWTLMEKVIVGLMLIGFIGVFL